MLLFRFPVGNRFSEGRVTAEEFQQEAAKWQKWMQKMLKEGRMVPGQRLTVSPAKVLKGSAKAVQDGPFAEGKEIVGSFCTIKARDLDEALELAKGCPILEQNGSVEVREAITNWAPVMARSH